MESSIILIFIQYITIHITINSDYIVVVDYLLRNGDKRFINDAKRRARDIAQLDKYKHYDQNNNDDARETRIKAKQVYQLLMDDKKLAEERTKASRIRDVKLQGFGSTEYIGDDVSNEFNHNDNYNVRQSHRANTTNDIDEYNNDHEYNDTVDNSTARSNRDGTQSRRRSQRNYTMGNDGGLNTIHTSEHAENDWGIPAQPKYNDNDYDHNGNTSNRRSSHSGNISRNKQSNSNADDNDEAASARKNKKKDKKSSRRTNNTNGTNTAIDHSDPFATNGNTATAAYSSYVAKPSSDDIFAQLAQSTPHTAQSNKDIDFLSTTTSVNDISDIFANASISPNRATSQQTNHSVVSSNENNNTRDELAFDSAPQSSQPRTTTNTTNNNPISLPGSDLFDLDNISGKKSTQIKRQSINDAGSMSMSAMRSTQPLGQQVNSQLAVIPQTVNSPLPSLYPGANMHPQSMHAMYPQQSMYGYPPQQFMYGQPQFYPPQQSTYGHPPQPMYHTAPQSLYSSSQQQFPSQRQSSNLISPSNGLFDNTQPIQQQHSTQQYNNRQPDPFF